MLWWLPERARSDGSVTNKVWVEASVPTEASKPFVQRHYEITPALNPTTATATVTLYFTQAEFTNFNNHPGSVLDLPSGPGDATGKANLRIGKSSGSSGTGTGLPSTYSGTTSVIDPDDASIVWNASSSAWEVSFAVSGFSGFVVQTDAYTLPVSLISFEVLKLGNSVKLIWVTAHEQNSLEFLVQQSVSGTDWVTLSTVVAAGNSNTNLNYNFLHKFPAKGMNYYRLIQKDIDGRSEISTVKQILFQTGLADVQIVNNPVHNGQFQVIINNGLQRVMLFNDLWTIGTLPATGHGDSFH